MKKVGMSREYSKWGTLDRDILAIIFGKLSQRDLYKGASRVCVSWFLAAHSKTLWSTVDLNKLNQVEEGFYLWNILNSMSKFFLDCCCVHKSLTNITKFSRTAPKNLFFNYNSLVLEADLMFAALSMPNIEKLALPHWYYLNKNTFRCASSNWKNLKTLIIAHDIDLTGKFEFQAVGENCRNLTNLKYLGYLDTNIADQIVRYLQNLKRLSLRGSMVSTRGVLSLIRGLQNLLILNMSHCSQLSEYRDPGVPIDNLVQAANQKIVKFILCYQGCSLCKVQRSFSVSWSKHWHNDEIHELEL